MPNPTYRDRYDLPLSAHSATAVDRYIEGVDRHLSRNGGARACFEAAVAADPGFALAQAALATLGGADGSDPDATETETETGTESGPETRSAVGERLRALAAPASAWERRHVEIVAALLTGHALRATILLREQLAAVPRDVLALKMAMGLLEAGGRADWPERRLALLDGVAAAYGDDWYFLGAYATAHEEAGRLAEARPLAERALVGNPRSADAAHALVHVQYELDEHRAGAAFLEDWLPGYERTAPYHCHLSWHLALFELARGRYARALQVYERDISPGAMPGHDGRGRLLDAASLLWRCRLADLEPDALDWTAICRLADRWARAGGKGTVAAHGALAYAADGDGAALGRLLDHLRQEEARGAPAVARAVLPLVEGVAAFAAGAYDEAVRLLDPVVDDIVCIGGSHAQREVFEDTLLEACLRAGRFERAEALVQARLERGPAARLRRTIGRARSSFGADDDGAILSGRPQERAVSMQ